MKSESKSSSLRRRDSAPAAAGTGSGRPAYEPPAISFRQSLEAVANVCEPYPLFKPSGACTNTGS